MVFQSPVSTQAFLWAWRQSEARWRITCWSGGYARNCRWSCSRIAWPLTWALGPDRGVFGSGKWSQCTMYPRCLTQTSSNTCYCVYSSFIDTESHTQSLSVVKRRLQTWQRHAHWMSRMWRVSFVSLQVSTYSGKSGKGPSFILLLQRCFWTIQCWRHGLWTLRRNFGLPWLGFVSRKLNAWPLTCNVGSWCHREVAWFWRAEPSGKYVADALGFENWWWLIVIFACP